MVRKNEALCRPARRKRWSFAAMNKLIAVMLLAAATTMNAQAAEAADAMICGTAAGPGSCKPCNAMSSCSGTVMVMDAWTEIGDCNFKTRSKVGQKILSVCEHGTKCWVEIESVKPDEDDIRVI